MPAWPDSPLLRDWCAPELSPLAAAEAARRSSDSPVTDFITAHPYDHGFRFDGELLSNIFNRATAKAARYSAVSLGQLPAREAVADFHGAGLSPSQVLLTPGTSMAYFYLFRLLARPHAEVLCPAPTYPLFDDLAKIAGLRVRRYHLHKSICKETGVTRWVIDPEELAFQITAHTCAIVLVSPHNPTGTIISTEEMSAIADVANEARVPVILDEVFRSYTRREDSPVSRPAEGGGQLSFTLNGLSKSHYLPGIKAGWIAVEGDRTAVGKVMNSLEYMADSFLPVQEITQASIPALLDSAAMAEADRLAALQRLRLEQRLLNTSGWMVAVPEAGPYVCLGLRPIEPSLPMASYDEKVAIDLLQTTGSLFHPGSLYSFPEPWLVTTVYNPADLPKPNYM